MCRLSRRNALTGALLAAVVPSEVLAEVDPHVEWLEECRRLVAVYNATEDEDAGDRLLDLIWQQVDLIINTPAVTHSGVISKIQVFREHTIENLNEDVRPTADAVLSEAVRFLARF